MIFEPISIQIAANAPGWGHWTRILAIAKYLPQIHFRIYHTDPYVPLPTGMFPHVKRVSYLTTGEPLICEHGWESALPYQPDQFPKALCIRKVSRRNPDIAGYDKCITVSDVDEKGDFPPVILETQELYQPFPSHVIVCNEKKNSSYLRQLHPGYDHPVVFPVTALRRSIQHLVGIAGYNLFWECSYYQIQCSLYPSTWPNDSHERLNRLGNQPMPPSFRNGAPDVAKALLHWWLNEAFQ